MEFYCEKDGEIPIIIRSLGKDIIVEVRNYWDGHQQGAIYQTMNFEQAKELAEKLKEYIREVEGERQVMLPCSECGCHPEIMETMREQGWKIQCRQCGISNFGRTAQEARDGWNGMVREWKKS